VDTSNLIQTVLIYALPVIFAITLHEAAHAYAARYFGDDTAYVLGRMTLNPMKHIDPVGTILMPLLLYFSTGFAFGYAKPVPVRFGRLRNPKRDMIWVAAAGPASNFVQAILWALLFVVLNAVGFNEDFFLQMAEAGIMVNLVMWAFNLFPLPPLDGGRVLAGLLPRGGAQNFLVRIEPYGIFIVMALVMLPRFIQAPNIIGAYWLTPLIRIGSTIINLLLSPILALLR
jgi:Zn-dependent protease